MKQYSLLLVAFLSVIGVQAQDARSFSLNLYGGYNFSDELDYDGYSATIEDGIQYGAGFEYFLTKNNSVELKYLRSDVKIPFYGPNGNQLNSKDKGAFNFILADYTYYFDTGSNLMPFLGAGAGVGIVESPQGGSGTYFAWNVKGGVKIKTASTVSVNINAYLQSMSAAVGESYYWDYWIGPVVIEDYISTFQFGLGATLSFNFKN